jgi:hypothetical protein
MMQHVTGEIAQPLVAAKRAQHCRISFGNGYAS